MYTSAADVTRSEWECATAAQKKTPETREQAKDFMLLLRELDPPVTARSRWLKVRLPCCTLPCNPPSVLRGALQSPEAESTAA